MQLMSRYIDPLVAQLKKMLSYRKFKKGTKAEVDEMLKTEKSEHPMRICYCFCISHEHPGTFLLAYIRTSNPRHEYIGLYPKGFKFRKQMFEDIDRLVAYFQKHIDDPKPVQRPSGWEAGSNNNESGGWKGGNLEPLLNLDLEYQCICFVCHCVHDIKKIHK